MTEREEKNDDHLVRIYFDRRYEKISLFIGSYSIVSELVVPSEKNPTNTIIPAI